MESLALPLIWFLTYWLLCVLVWFLVIGRNFLFDPTEGSVGERTAMAIWDIVTAPVVIPVQIVGWIIKR